MFILLFQTVHQLFFAGMQNQLSSSVDVVFRTAIASIFGYFVSANFLTNEGVQIAENTSDQSITKLICDAQQVAEDVPASDDSESIPPDNRAKADNSSVTNLDKSLQNKFAEHTFSIPMQNNLQEKVKESYVYKVSRKNQIIVVTTIGVFVLLVLIIARDFEGINTKHIAMITQLRDMFCGALGFLLGTPAKENN